MVSMSSSPTGMRDPTDPNVRVGKSKPAAKTAAPTKTAKSPGRTAKPKPAGKTAQTKPIQGAVNKPIDKSQPRRLVQCPTCPHTIATRKEPGGVVICHKCRKPFTV